MAQGNYGRDLFGGSPYGGVPGPFGAISAQSQTPYAATVTFNDLLDFTYLPNLDPTNYSIPGLSVLAVSQYTAATVWLETSAQSNVLYTVTIGFARDYFQRPLDPSLNQVTFQGDLAQATMTPVAVSDYKVRVVFSEVMLDDSNLRNALNYVVTDMSGNVITVDSATPEQPSNVVSVALSLDSPLVTDNTYQVTIDSSVHTLTGGLSVTPDTVKFFWVEETVDPILIPFKEFTGEVANSIFGNPNGLVFFSPALNVSTPNSVIQVEEVDVCTTAFDTYQMPQPIDPIPLYTFGLGQPAGSVLGPGAGTCLWAPFPRLAEAQFILSNTGSHYVELVPHASDGMVVAIFQESWNLADVALLNNPAYVLFELGLPDPPPPATVPVTQVQFITANNLAPIPPGTTDTFRVVSFQMKGQSTLTADLKHRVHLTASLVAGSGFITLPAEAALRPNATVTAHARLKGAAHAAIQGGASLTATLSVGP